MAIKNNKPTFYRHTIFRKILTIFVLLSLIPVVFSAFLTISTYQGVLSGLIEEGVFPAAMLEQLRQNILIQISLILLLLIILIVFASILVARSITRPLSALSRGAREISEENLDIRFKINSRDELGYLADAFNKMVLKLKEQREREALVDQMKTEFISVAAHQLRTPLSSVKWMLKMVMDGDVGSLSPGQSDLLAKGYSANERMIHLVNDLLDISRIEEGRFGIEFSKNDLDAALREIVNSFGGQAKTRNVSLEYKPLRAPLRLVFDDGRVKMVLSNLIDNAIRYTPPRGKVIVFVEEDSSLIKVGVKDTGAGIPENQKNKVFTKFFRGDNVVKMQTEGTGLGLYLCKNIVEKHGGKIWFESKKDQGSVFYFTLSKNIPETAARS